MGSPLHQLLCLLGNEYTTGLMFSVFTDGATSPQWLLIWKAIYTFLQEGSSLVCQLSLRIANLMDILTRSPVYRMSWGPDKDQWTLKVMVNRNTVLLSTAYFSSYTFLLLFPESPSLYLAVSKLTSPKVSLCSQILAHFLLIPQFKHSPAANVHKPLDFSYPLPQLDNNSCHFLTLSVVSW